VEKGRDRYGSYFLGLKIRGKGDEHVPLFVTGLSDITGNTKTVMDSVTDTVTVESTGSDRCYRVDDKKYNLLEVETRLAQVEQYTTALEKELREQENLEQKRAQPSGQKTQSTEGDETQVTVAKTKEPVSTFTYDDGGLKVGDRVRYVGKKHREYYEDEVMEVVEIKRHWTGNQITCNSRRRKGWTTWIAESCLQKVKV